MGRNAVKKTSANDVLNLFTRLSKDEQDEVVKSILAIRNADIRNKRAGVKNQMGRDHEARGRRVRYTNPKTGATRVGTLVKMKRKYAEMKCDGDRPDQIWNVPITWLEDV